MSFNPNDSMTYSLKGKTDRFWWGEKKKVGITILVHTKDAGRSFTRISLRDYGLAGTQLQVI